MPAWIGNAARLLTIVIVTAIAWYVILSLAVILSRTVTAIL